MDDIRPRLIRKKVTLDSRRTTFGDREFIRPPQAFDLSPPRVDGKLSNTPESSAPQNAFGRIRRVRKYFSSHIPRFSLPRRAVTAGGLSFVIIAELIGAAFLPQLINPDKFYKLTPEAQSVVGEVSQELANKISYDAENQLYQYNKEAAPIDQSNADNPEAVAAQLAAQQAGGNSEKIGGGADNYTVDMSIDPEKGVTVRDATDKSGSLAVSLIPQFDMRPAKQMDDRIVYPLKGINGQVVYSVKSNGLKEDIVLYESPGNELELKYELQIPDSLEARLLNNGAIGVYSADTTLFGDISFGSDKDREMIEKARQNSDKNHLAFTIPAPTVVEPERKETSVKSEFFLDGNLLTIKASGLAQASYPLSIDPSVVVSSAAEHAQGNLEDGIEINGSGHVERAGLTGGSLKNFTPTSSLVTARAAGSMAAYNGYIYYVGGGGTGVDQRGVIFAPINSNGTLGAWNYTSNFTNNGTTFVAGLNAFRSSLGVVTYNGYIYAVGGNASGTPVPHVEYAKINPADGTVGPWTHTTPLTGLQRFGHKTIAYNGYMYVLAGCLSWSLGRCTTITNDVRYAPINGDGTIGAWVGTSNTGPVRNNPGAVAYNGYMYVAGGCMATDFFNPICSVGSYTNDVRYAPINADGSLGNWTATTPMFGASFADLEVINGYLYQFYQGGTRTDYASINADGSIGSWQQTSDYAPVNTGNIAFTTYKNFIYTGGGCISGCTGNEIATVRVAEVKPAGTTGSYTVDGDTFGSASYGASTVAYEGYLYVIGGCTNISCTTITNSVRYAPIAANGTIGAFTTDATGTQPTARFGHASFAFNGRLYIVGGCSVVVLGGCTNRQNDIQYSGTIASGNPGAWASDSSNPFTNTRFDHDAIVHNGRVYVAGGCSSTTCPGNTLNDVQYATINSGGDIGTFSSFGNFDSTGRTKISLVSHGNYLYVVGGHDESSVARDDIRYAEINASTGAIVGSWNDAGNTFSTGRYWHTSFTDKGHLYVMGGCGAGNCTNILGDTQYARINNDGTIEAFNTATSLNTVRYIFDTTTYNGYVYAAGGCTGVSSCTSILGNVEYAPINNGGPGTLSSLGNTGTFSTARWRHSTVAYNGYIYMLGGNNVSNDDLNTVEYAPINNDGTIGAWNSASSFTTGRRLHTALAYEGYMYILGGIGGAGGNVRQNDVQYAPINSDGSLGTWNPTSSFTTPRFMHSAAVYDGHIYIIGGCATQAALGGDAGKLCSNSGGSTLNDVQYASINSNGTVGAWNPTSSFTTARYAHTSIAVNGFVYLIGGCTSITGGGSCNGMLNDVLYASINPNGTIGSWRETNKFYGERFMHGTVAANGFVYVFGGFISTAGGESTVQYASIESDGSLSPWSSTTNMSAARFAFGNGAFYEGRVYAPGGNSGGTTNVIYMGQHAIPRKGTYSRLFDLGGDARATYMLLSGTESRADSLRFGFRNAPNATGVFGSLTSTYDVESDELYSFAANENRYRWFRFDLNDSQNAVFPDSLGPVSTIEDYEIWFHAATDNSGSLRLRNGGTFINGTQNSLDAQPQ